MTKMLIKYSYKYILKPILFSFDPEFVHDMFTKVGKILGKYVILRKLTKALFYYSNHKLNQNLFGVKFENPVGLSAGFDYNGYISDILGEISFGFASIGTVTFGEYIGNPKPRLVRLPKSKSLLVNKGFKSEGIKNVLRHSPNFSSSCLRYGISIGATNSVDTSTTENQIADIIKAFKYLTSHEKSNKFSYYELNISCPNVLGSGSLAQPESLEKVLNEINKINITKPLFVKFQLEIDWEDAKKLIEIMIANNVDAIIIANLLKKKENFSFDEDEISDISRKGYKGNYSGKPTFDLSNQLIRRTYKEFGDKIKIIGVGGIFSAEDAYLKIKLGASLVQLITGMVFEGPQVISEINNELVKFLERDGYSNISEAVGSDV